MIIAVDFDGTCVTHEYPKMGATVPGAVSVLREITKHHHLILLTMRSGKELEAAAQWFKSAGIDLWAVNENPGQKTWTQSPKVYAHIYIDDAAVGCPLVKNAGGRPYVNWSKVKAELQKLGVLPC